MRIETYSINTLQEDVTKDIKGVAAPRLNASVDHAVPCIREAQILFLYRELLTPNSKADNGQLSGSVACREDVALLGGIVFAAWDGLVDSLAGRVVNKAEGGSRIGNGGVAGALNCLASHHCRGGVEHPEALGVIDGSVVGGLAAEGSLINVAEGIERLAFVRIIRVFYATKVGREKLRVLWNITLADHVLDGCLDGSWLDGIDASPSKAKKAVTGILLKLGREGLGQFDSLVLDHDTAKVDRVCTNSARGAGAVTVGDLPGGASHILKGARLGGVENSMAGTTCSCRR